MLYYVRGDATRPGDFPGCNLNLEAPVIIAHVCNDVGLWGAGFSGALSHTYPVIETLFAGRPRPLGHVQFSNMPIPRHTMVANMVAQHKVCETGQRRPPIRYAALAACMHEVAQTAQNLRATIHAPRFGAGLAGGDWKTIEAMILEVWVERGIDVFVYDYELDYRNRRVQRIVAVDGSDRLH